MSTLLALDLGSTHFKARAYDARLRPLAESVETLSYRYGQGGKVEIAADGVGRAVAAVLHGITTRVTLDRLRVICITSQAQTFTLLDPEGRPTRPFVSWMDSRARETAEDLGRSPLVAELPKHGSFGSALPGLTLSVLAHFARAEPGLLPLAVSFLPGYVAGLLGAEPAVDDNLAAMSGLYSLELRAWWPAALECCGLRAHDLPRLVPVGRQAGVTTARARTLGLGAGVPILYAGNDQTAGAYACRLHERGSLLLTLGTAQVAYSVCDSLPRPDPGLFRGPFPGGRFYRGAVDEGGGSLVSRTCGLLKGCDTPRDFFALAARSAAGSRGLVFGPGGWRGLSAEHGPAELARSVLEYIVARAAALVRALEPRPEAREILVAGGGSREPLWVQLLREELGARLTVVDADPLLGAALLGSETLTETNRQTNHETAPGSCPPRLGSA